MCLRLGPFNVHGSLLPKYRGAAPIQWAVINGDTETGITIMKMEAGLDTGPMVAVAKTKIADTELRAPCSSAGSSWADLLMPTLEDVNTGRARFELRRSTGNLAPMLNKEHGHLDFRSRRGWFRHAAAALIRGPGAFALLDDAPVNCLLQARPWCGTAGRVVAADKNGVSVACGDGAVAFTELQMPGTQAASIRSCGGGPRIVVGAQFT
jgi:methionyl-tRNA formyltransferase